MVAFQLKRESCIHGQMWTSNADLSNSAFHFKCESEQLHISLQTRVWATPHFTLNAGLSKSVSLQMRIWAISHLSFNARLWASRFDLNAIMRRLWVARLHNSTRSARDLRFCYRWSLLLGQLTPHIMWELIPIMKGFWRTIIPLRPPIISL